MYDEATDLHAKRSGNWGDAYLSGISDWNVGFSILYSVDKLVRHSGE